MIDDLQTFYIYSQAALSKSFTASALFSPSLDKWILSDLKFPHLEIKSEFFLLKRKGYS